MRLQTKISLAIFPMVMAAIFSLGAWSINTTTEGIHSSIFQFMEQELNDFLDHKVTDLHELLEKNRLSQVDSFVKEYQLQAISSSKDMHSLKTSALLILDESGRKIHASSEELLSQRALWAEIGKRIISQKSKLIRGHIEIPGGERIYVGRFFKPWKWVVLYSVLEEEIHSPERRIRNATIGVAILCLLGGFILIFLTLNKFVVRPVTQLKKTAETITDHKDIDGIEIYSKDELGDLARSMESMARSIYSYKKEQENWQNKLEQEIKARTQDLNKTNESLKSEIATRRQIEERMSETLDLNQKIIYSSSKGLIAYDSTGQCVLANDSAAKIVGATREDLLKQNFNNIKSWKRSGLLEMANSVFVDGKENYLEVNTKSSFGKEVWLNCHIARFTSGGESHLLLILDDLTEHKKFEAELISAREAAEEASQAKSQFLSSMSHEIRTPMNAIIGMADVLSETTLNHEQHQLINIFKTAGRDLLAIINNVLDISKMEADQLKMESIDFNLEEIIKRTCETLTVHARNRGLELKYNISPDAVMDLTGDPYRLGQVLVNLIGNAIKFTEQGHVLVEVCRHSFNEDDDNALGEHGHVKITFSIIDTGIGIPADKQGKIFENFTQVDSSTTRKYGGTGLGLSIAKRLIENMGGSIHVESSPSGGSAFIFTAIFGLPAEKGKSFSPDGKTEKISRIPPHKIEIPPSHILLVEDSESNQIVVKTFLRDTPVRIDIAENGRIALNKFTRQQYDLVLMDMQMPVMDGYTATREIRKFERKNKLVPVPIIAMTAYALSGEADKSFTAGCNDYLAKPVGKKSFLELMGRYLRNGKEKYGNKGEKSQIAHGKSDSEEKSLIAERVVVDVDPVLKQYLPSFIETLNKNIKAIKGHLDQMEFEHIHTLGHKMKGDGGTYGMERVTELGAMIQTAAEKEKTDTIKQLVEDLSSYIDCVEVDS